MSGPSSPPPLPPEHRPFGPWSGFGLVVANMVGAGVFLSTGFMAQSLTPRLVLLTWVIGGVLAFAGARAYAEVARLVPHGGGEYRYLSTLLHPALGYLAGWASLLVGFSAPIALDAMAAGAFAHVLWPALGPRPVAAALVVVLTLAHAGGLHSSVRAQNGLVAVKVLLLLGFAGIGLAAGSLSFPTWTPPEPAAETVPAVMKNLFYVAFAYSGWNAAAYASDEFRDPRRDVPRAMLRGCLAVAALYLVVNFVFVANLTPADGAVVFNWSRFASLDGAWEQVTLGQAVMTRLLGPGAGKAMSGVMLLLFVSAMSAMMLVGPRVYAAMARDGVLPRALVGRPGRPPTAAVFLQGALSLVVLFTHRLQEVLANVGAVLVLFAALTVLGLFGRLHAPAPEDRPRPAALAAALVYVLSAVSMLYYGFRDDPSLVLWLAAIGAAALVGRAVTRRGAAKGLPAAPGGG